MGTGVLGVLLGDETAADPVPVCRPVLCFAGVPGSEDEGTVLSDTGRTKMGSNLEITDCQRQLGKGRI
jgi:hypothetical protein